MQNDEAYENFPIWIPLLAWVLSLSIYALGAYIFWSLYIPLIAAYIIYCLWIEYRILRFSCVNCYYYGKTCGIGRGKLCAMLFKKGNPESFLAKEIAWKDLIPDFLVMILPLVCGIVILIRDFNWLILVLMVVLVMLSMGGNALIRGSLGCKYCKQRELGCPAEQLFNKGAKTVGS
jgi:hypothetical protein